MKKDPDQPRESPAAAVPPRFYLIFDEMAKLGVEENISPEEIEEIERIGLMAQDATEEDQPRFMTST